MDNVIWAAPIQAAPIACAAVAGFEGLTTWRKQLREGRRVKHAEKALAAAGWMSAAIRAARSAHSQISEAESAILKGCCGCSCRCSRVCWQARGGRSDVDAGLFVRQNSHRMSCKGAPPAARLSAAPPVKADVIRCMAAAQQLVGGKKEHLLSARLDEALVAAAKARTGIKSDTALAEYALATVALGDDYGEWLLSQAGQLDRTFELDF
jgi:hypothetical protein